MTPDIFQDGDARIFRASKALQEKAGTGDIDPQLIRKADLYLQDHSEDFRPLAVELVSRLESIIGEIRRTEDFSPDSLDTLGAAVMEIKANGRMFRYDLASTLAATVLDFLEMLDRLDEDALELAQALQTCLKVIVARNITGGGGLDGHHLRTEMDEACLRYRRKKPQNLKTGTQ